MTRVERYILTGTPGAGKTSILQHLAALGYATVAEAATAVIADEQARGHAQPWTHPSFIDAIVAAQRQARAAASTTGVQFHDRSPICTHVLATWLGFPIPAALAADLDTITRDKLYNRHVFFIRNLGFCEQTAARRISYADCLAFERLHERTYRAFGYQLIDVPAAPVPDRVAQIRTTLSEITNL